MTLPDLAIAARRSGLRVIELNGWRTRGRPASTGGFSPKGVLCHHTGGAPDSREYAEWMATVGRSDLPAPLVQLALSRTGIVYVCAAGRANHAGEARASGPIPAGDGNALYVGIEAMNTGSEGWDAPAVTADGQKITQREAYARLCAALCEHYGWPASHVRAHRETSVTGKPDPGRLDMDDHRARVARLMRDGIPVQPRKPARANHPRDARRSINAELDLIGDDRPTRRRRLVKAREWLRKITKRK